MSDAILLGVDGGGSKTAFALADTSGRALARVVADTTNYHQVGFAGVRDAIVQALAALRAQSALPATPLAGAVLGLGAVGEIAADMALLLPAIAEALAPTPHHVVNDAEVGWAGALALEPGVNLIAGTGSLAFAVNEKGETARVGGWAWAVGDEGSAHWLSRRILSLFTRQADGRLPRTPLYALVRERLGLTDDIEMRWLPFTMPRKDLAALCTVLPEAERSGDETPLALYREAAQELALHIQGVRAQLAFADTIRVSATGGVFRLSPVIREHLAALLPAHGAVYAAPRTGPVEGALLLAAQRFRPQALEAFRARLVADHPFAADPASPAFVSPAFASLESSSEKAVSDAA